MATSVQWIGIGAPSMYEGIQSVTVNPDAHGGQLIEKRVVMPHRQNTVYITYTRIRARVAGARRGSPSTRGFTFDRMKSCCRARSRVCMPCARSRLTTRSRTRSTWACRIGSISEIFDAEPPYTPRGCCAQAWSVAEALRVLSEVDAALKQQKATAKTSGPTASPAP